MGDILSITEREIGYLAVIFVLAVLFYTVCFNGLHAAGLHRTLAASRHIPVRLLENLFAVFVALVVTLSIKWDFDYQCAFDFACGGGAEPGREYAGIPFLCGAVFHVFRSGGAVCIVLYECGCRAYDCNFCGDFVFCNLFLCK